jgi:hypothetical protein
MFMVYLTTMSVAQIILNKMLRLLVNNELERTWKEAIVVQFEAISRNFPVATEEDHNQSQ